MDEENPQAQEIRNKSVSVPLLPKDREAMSKSKKASPLEQVKKFIGAEVRITMDDKRVVVGKFCTLDRMCNIVLKDVIEFRRIGYAPDGEESGDAHVWDTERELPCAVVPGCRLVRVEMKKGLYTDIKMRV